MRKNDSGQTIYEYALIAALVGIVAIGALTVFSNDFRTALPGLLQDIFGGGGGQSVASGGVGGQSIGSGHQAPGPTPGTTTATPTTNTPTNGLSNALPPPTGSQAQVCFQSGICINMPTIAGGPIDTTGGMGGTQTRQMATVLQQLAQQLKAQGVNPNLITLIENLANKGHELGAAEDDLAQYCAGNGASCTMPYNDPRVAVVNGKVMNISTTLANDFQTRMNQLTTYLESNPGALPPVAQAIINQQASQIYNIAQGFSSGEDDIGDNNLVSNPAQITHQNSNTICHTGGATTCMQRVANGAPIPINATAPTPPPAPSDTTGG